MLYSKVDVLALNTYRRGYILEHFHALLNRPKSVTVRLSNH